jgi:hypothetical protein
MDGATASPVRLHRVVLSDTAELEITVSCHAGRLRTPVLFTSWDPFDGKSAVHAPAY